MSRPSPFWVLVAAACVIFLLAPLLLVVLFAFTSQTITNFPIESLSLRWWRTMLEHPQFLPSLTRSLVIGLTTALVSAVVGTMAAAGLASLTGKRASLILAIVSLPMMLPPLVLAVSLVAFYVSLGVPLGILTVTVSHILLTQPFVILIVYAQMRDFDVRIIESARDLGASPWTAFRTITLPIIRPTVVGAALMTAAISFDDFVITFFTIGGGNTLPTFVWGMMRTSITPVINAIGTLLITATIACTLLGLWMTRYRG
jgi:spermidine/putrescine transport system permease protein